MSLMLAEIQQQPAALERIVRNESGRIARFAASAQKRRTRLIVLVARGSSDNAALFGRYLLEISTGIPVSLAKARGLSPDRPRSLAKVTKTI